MKKKEEKNPVENKRLKSCERGAWYAMPFLLLNSSEIMILTKPEIKSKGVMAESITIAKREPIFSIVFWKRRI